MSGPTLDGLIHHIESGGQASAAVILAQLRRLKATEAALTPSGDTKAAYSGEFRMLSPSGRPGALIPWDTIKQIMAAIRDRATITEQTNG